VVGFLVADSIPAVLQIGLVFLAPVYFFVFLIVEVRSRLTGIAIACGGIAGPLFYLVTPQWSVLIAGFAGGTLAYAIHRTLERARA
jgi:predicted branched-subunit amino acid permease